MGLAIPLLNELMLSCESFPLSIKQNINTIISTANFIYFICILKRFNYILISIKQFDRTVIEIKIRENRSGNQLWKIQRHGQHWEQNTEQRQTNHNN